MNDLEFYIHQHRRCPRCNSDRVITTLACINRVSRDVEYKDFNGAWCDDCKWSGIGHDLVPHCAGLAHSVERLAYTQEAAGSKPAPRTKDQE